MKKPLDKTTLYLRDLPRELVRSLNAQAALRGMTLTAFVIDILSRAAGQETPSAMRRLESDMTWYEARKPRLLRRYRGQHLAILDRRIIDHDRDFNALAQRVFARVGVRSVFMPLCVDGERVVCLRSPHLVRS